VNGPGDRDGADDLPDLARRQLAALDRIVALFERRGFEYWLFGGWAVDFYVGSVTRAHDDVDLAIWLADLDPIAALVEGAGWRHAPAEDEDGGTGYEREEVRLELTYLVRDDAGDVFIPLRGGRIPWDRRTFGDDERSLLGVRSRLITLASLTGMKSSPRDDPGDADKDRADAEALRRSGGER
jgi:hypothetical protein